jgi:hypothetical protein
VSILSPADMQKILIQEKYETDGFYESFLLDLSAGLNRSTLRR